MRMRKEKEKKKSEFEQMVADRTNKIIAEKIEEGIKQIYSGKELDIMLENQKLKEIVHFLLKEKFPEMISVTIMGMEFKLKD